MKTKNYLLGTFIVLLAFIIMACGESQNANKNAAGNNDNVTLTAASNSGTQTTVDVNNSIVNWKASKVTGKHNGTVKIKDGTIYVQNGQVTGGNFNIDMNTITVSDLTGESNQKLTGHLKSNDFFSVESNPTSSFVITEIGPGTNGATNTIKGNLTIKGITKPVQFPANIQVNNGKVTAKATFDIDRTEYDIKYGSGKFFEGIGDKAIHDNFNIELDLMTN
ncbi:MAG TPA: YceI family protein [Ignavibacteria bacterium]|nr:YceI family protein [Ignavibacteria bacterium]